MTTATYMFSYSKMANIDYDLDFSGCKSLNYIFAYASAEYIKSVRFPTAPTTTSNPFSNCSELVEIRVKGSISFTISFQWCPLSVESMKSIINALVDYSGTESEHTFTIRFSDDCWVALNADETPPDGYVTWQEYVTNALKWNT
jgi:hypothetical protein